MHSILANQKLLGPVELDAAGTMPHSRSEKDGDASSSSSGIRDSHYKSPQ